MVGIVAIVSYLAAAMLLASQAWPSLAFSIGTVLVIDPMSLGLRWLWLLVGLVFTLVAARAGR